MAAMRASFTSPTIIWFRAKNSWNWRNGTSGRMWDKILTDTDGPYIELMAGAYSDNQPDYSWIQPYETKTVKQYWYPIRQLGGIKNANLDAAINLEVDGSGTARLALNTTAEFAGAKVLLKVGEKTLLSKVIDINPEKPFVQEVALPPGVRSEDLKATLLSAEGKELISYQPVKPKGAAKPKPVEPPPPPKDVKSNGRSCT